MVPSIASATTLEPLAAIKREAKAVEAERGGAADISIMAGFSYADTPDTGFTALVTGTLPQADLDAIAGQFSQRIHDLRAEVYGAAPVMPVEEAVRRAAEGAATAAKPYVILEHADRMCDSTYTIAELLRQGVGRAAIPFVWDAEAARAAHEAGAGATVTLQIGGWTSDRAGPRLSLPCTVLQTGEKRFQTTGPMRKGQWFDLGLCALVEVEGLTISLTSRAEVAIDEDCFTVFGLKARDFDIIVLRSKTHFRAVYEPLAEAILIADTPDWGTADLLTLPYERVDRRRVYPFTESA
jgi:microcystin degradation protein MlrC